MRRLVAILCLGLMQGLHPAPSAAGPDDPFRSEQLSRQDSRFLQSALSLSGHYSGLIDGAWGSGSARALVAATRPDPTEIDVLGALLPLIEDAESGWMALNWQSASLLVPGALLNREDREEDPFLSYATPTRDLILRVLFGSARDASDRHGWLADNTVADAYTADTRTAYITRGRLADGDTVYLWTRRVDGVFVSVLVQWAPRQAGRARLMVASLSTGYVSDLSFAPDGYLARMADDLGAGLSPDLPASRLPRPSDAPPGGPAPGDVLGTGTGFHVSPSVIVTAAHVVEGCGTLRLEDGAPVARLASDRTLDLAVLLRAGVPEGEEPAWLALAGAAARLGSPVTAVGYPYSGLFEQGVTATGGNVSALRGLAGSMDEMLLSAPVQPGNSGGPLLDRTGRVVGVVTARASEAYVREMSGSAPENMNVATQLEPLRAFLQTAGVALPDAGAVEPDASALADGLPDAVIRAVVQLQCLQ